MKLVGLVGLLGGGAGGAAVGLVRIEGFLAFGNLGGTGVEVEFVVMELSGLDFAVAPDRTEDPLMPENEKNCMSHTF